MADNVNEKVVSQSEETSAQEQKSITIMHDVTCIFLIEIEF